MRIAKNPRFWPWMALATIPCLILLCIFSAGAAQSAASADGPRQDPSLGQAVATPTPEQPCGQSDKPEKGEDPHSDVNPAQPRFLDQTSADVETASTGCLSCHRAKDGSPAMRKPDTVPFLFDSTNMHETPTVPLGCQNCHGGRPCEMRPEGTHPGDPQYEEVKKRAHVTPRYGDDAPSDKLRIRPYTRWLKETPDYIQFINPGDLRVADRTCGSSGCHVQEVDRVRGSMMTHGAMLWAAALYNNGSFPLKDAHFGQSYNREGLPQRLETRPRPNPKDTREKGILPYLEPLERWEVSQPGNVLRVFERGGGGREEVGNPQDEDQPGRPDAKLSDRGFGTLLRTDPTFLGLQKTRLFDPLLSFPGTNDHPGDYRGSGCTGCHVIYANDRSSEHSGFYSRFGNNGQTNSTDSAILGRADRKRNESGHPIQHVLTKVIPSSQCMVCHIHPGTNMVASYFGDTWWDNEADAEQMYPKNPQTGEFIQKNPSQQEYHDAHEKNPEGSAAKGKWNAATKEGDEFLRQVGEPKSQAGGPIFNDTLKRTQFDDFHSHGWIFRKVFKQDRHGNLLDENNNQISFDSKDKFKKAVHLKDIHLEKGMHCVDCHFNQDVHGNGKLYGETRNAIEISCTDCHGTVGSYSTLASSGPAAPDGGTNLQAMRTPWGERRFYWQDGKLYQRSSVEPKQKPWEVVQVNDVVTEGRPHYSREGSLAMTLQKGGKTWGTVPDDYTMLAHPDSRMTCVSCHSSWTTTCFGCHLPMTANQRTPMLQNEGSTTRNWIEYDFQVLRNDMYMLGIDGTVTGNKVAPIRSACAVIVSSQNQNRDWIYYGQQTISSEGFSGTAFSPYVPHTVRSKETRGCTDCHVSSENDNNAWMAQLLLQGTNFLNYLGRYAYVATEKKGFAAIAFAELKEPEAVIGSKFHSIAYPDNYWQHQKKNKLELKEAYEHPGKEVMDVQLRGEYLYAAMGKGGLRIYDVANIENKDFSERMITAPVSRLGQRFFVRTSYAMAVAAPSTTAIDPTRTRFPENQEREYEKGKGLVPPMYAFLYVADKEEGLVVIGNTSKDDKTPKPPKTGGVSTLLDGEPRNNFLERATLELKDKDGHKLRAFLKDENGSLEGAHRITIAGNYAYILCNAGLAVVNLEDPLRPRITKTIGAPGLKNPRGIGIQFRYAFVVDDEGMKVLDVTHLENPRLLPDAKVEFSAARKFSEARNITVSRTYAYIAAGKDGMAIVNIEKPEQPTLYKMFTGGKESQDTNGKPQDPNDKLQDTNDIKIGMVSSSQFALVADGKAGFKVVQLFAPDDSSHGFYGFAPVPNPMLIAKYKTHGRALAVSRGVDRDRAVDEGGHQLSVFGRRGSRPFNLEEMQRMFLCTQAMRDKHLCSEGELYTVTGDLNNPVQHARKPAASGVSGSK